MRLTESSFRAKSQRCSRAHRPSAERAKPAYETIFVNLAPMPNLENLKKQAKLILRWHREQRVPVAQRIRNLLPAFRHLSDAEILRQPFRLAQAQELIARENGFESWEALKLGVATMPVQSKSETPTPKLVIAFPQVFVRDIDASADFYKRKLGFEIDYIFGSPPFYALVARDGVTLNLRRLDTPVFIESLRQRNDVLAANIVVENVKELFLEYQAAGAPFRQTLRRQPWGAEDFSVEDPDGNLLLFASLNDSK